MVLNYHPGSGSASPGQGLPFSSVSCCPRLNHFLEQGSLGMVIWKNSLRLQVTLPLPALLKCSTRAWPVPPWPRPGQAPGWTFCVCVSAMTTHQTRSDNTPKKMLGKPESGRGPNSCTSSNNSQWTQDNWAAGCASTSKKLSWQLRNADKQHAKNLTFPQTPLVIAKCPTHLIREEVLFVFWKALSCYRNQLTWICARMQARLGCRTDLVPLSPEVSIWQWLNEW